MSGSRTHVIRRLWTEDSSSHLSKVDFNTLAFEKQLTGASGGVALLKDQDGKRYTLKTASTPYQLKDECLADAIYRTMGMNVPEFAIYQGLPEQLAKQLKRPADTLFRLATFIKPDTSLSQKEKATTIKEQLEAGYALDCLLANINIIGHCYNVLIDQNQKVWRVNNDSMLRFHAWGELQEPKATVNELDSIKHPTFLMRQIFGDISDQVIQEQVKIILENRTKILNLFYEMHNKLHFEKPDMLLQTLVNRLQNLQEQIGLNLYCYAPTHSEAHLKYTGAGTLIYAIHEGEPHILLGKRRGHEWWGSFGGESDQQDLFLSETAARESNEELMNIYSVHPHELERAPSHDLLIDRMYDKNLTRHSMPKFRMYFLERAYIESNVFNQAIKKQTDRHKLEHTEFAWIKASDLHNTIQKGEVTTHFDTYYGKQSTRAVKTHDKKEFMLHPPLALMLEQAAVIANLKRLKEKQPLDRHHSRSRLSKRYPSTLVTLPQNDARPDEITIKAERQEQALTILTKGLIQRELLQRSKTKRQSTSELKQRTKPTQSELGLQATLGDQYQSEGLHKNVQTFAKQSLLKDAPISQEQQAIFVNILEEERAHLNSYVFYHAARDDLGFLYDLFTEFRRQLEHRHETNFHVLRAFDNMFAEFQDLASFMSAHKSLLGEISNYKKDYQEMGLSTNPFLFGSDGKPTSATYYLWLTNQSQSPPDIKRLWHYFMTRLGINDNETDFEKLRQVRAKAGGQLYQIFVDPSVIDEVAYPAGLGGLLKQLQTDDKTINVFSEVMTTLRENPSKYKDDIKDLQARLFLNPTFFHDTNKVKIKSWQAHPMTSQEKEFYTQSIQRFVSHSLITVLRDFKSISETLFAKGKPSLMKISEWMNQTQSLPAEKITDPRIIIPEMIAQKNYPKLLHYIKEFREEIDFNLKEISRDYMTSRKQHSQPLIHVIMCGILKDMEDNSAEMLQTLTNLISIFSQKQWLKLVKMTDDDGNTILHKAAPHPKTLKTILKALHKDTRLEAVNVADLEGYTVLHYAAFEPESMQYILNTLKNSQDRLTALKLANKFGHMALHYAVFRPKSLKYIFNSLKNNRLEAAKVTDLDGKTVLHHAACNEPNSLKAFIYTQDKQDRLTALKLANNTALFGEAQRLHPGLFTPRTLNKKDQLTLFKLCSKYEYRVMHLAALSRKSMQYILDSLNKNDRLEAAMVADKDGLKVLDITKSYPKALEVIQTLCLEDKKENTITKQGLFAQSATQPNADIAPTKKANIG